jgi:hypothetical protein
MVGKGQLCSAESRSRYETSRVSDIETCDNRQACRLFAEKPSSEQNTRDGAVGREERVDCLLRNRPVNKTLGMVRFEEKIVMGCEGVD